MEKIGKKGYVYDCLLPWKQSAIYSYERKRNPECVANLHFECQELKPKVKTNSSFLVLNPSSGVDTDNTVGSHLSLTIFRYRTLKLASLGSLLHRSLLGLSYHDFNGLWRHSWSQFHGNG